MMMMPYYKQLVVTFTIITIHISQQISQAQKMSSETEDEKAKKILFHEVTMDKALLWN